MNAEEARTITERYLKGDSLKWWLERIDEVIKEAALQGDDFVSSPIVKAAPPGRSPSKEMAAEIWRVLKKRGFNVEHNLLLSEKLNHSVLKW